MKRPRGTGSVFRMKGSSILWIKYHRNGKPIRESAHTTKVKEAEKVLRTRLAAISTGTYIGPKLEKMRVCELADDLVRDYRINGRKSIDDLEARWRLHLEPCFGALRAVEVTSQHAARYIDTRQLEEAENATINRELAALKRMFNLARESTPPKVNTVPYIPMLKEDNVRTGFLESKQYDRLAAETGKIGLWLRAMFEVGYVYGWRHEELLDMLVGQINVSRGTIRLEPGTTKNKKGREVSMTLTVKPLLIQCLQGKEEKDHVFTRDNGEPVRDFRGSWANVCEAAGVPELLFHDLRRTAARNLRRAGVAEGVIMKIGGWLTRSVFERYAIVSQTDICEAMTKLEAKQRSDSAEAEQERIATELQFGQSLDRIAHKMPEDNTNRSFGTPPIN